MDGDDLGVFFVAVIAILLLFIWILQFLAIFVVIFFLGVVTNLILRFIPNQFDWQKFDERWIWIVIIGISSLPIVIGLGLVFLPLILTFVFANADFLKAWLIIPLYLVWLGGYIWAWQNPEYEKGAADVLMSSTMILLWAKLLMWWEYQKVLFSLSNIRSR